jgi:hypothetical protein
MCQTEEGGKEQVESKSSRAMPNDRDRAHTHTHLVAIREVALRRAHVVRVHQLVHQSVLHLRGRVEPIRAQHDRHRRRLEERARAALYASVRTSSARRERAHEVVRLRGPSPMPRPCTSCRVFLSRRAIVVSRHLRSEVLLQRSDVWLGALTRHCLLQRGTTIAQIHAGRHLTRLLSVAFSKATDERLTRHARECAL